LWIRGIIRDKWMKLVWLYYLILGLILLDAVAAIVFDEKYFRWYFRKGKKNPDLYDLNKFVFVHTIYSAVILAQVVLVRFTDNNSMVGIIMTLAAAFLGAVVIPYWCKKRTNDY
jgi:hypothetical protein